MKSALLLYPHQLFDVKHLPEVDIIYLVEEPLYFGVDQQFPARFHKQKLVLHRASMRRYVEETLWPAMYEVEYLGLDVLRTTEDVLDKMKNIDRIYVFDLADEVLTKRLLEARRQHPEAPAIEFLRTPAFYLDVLEAREYFANKHGQAFADFYQWQRERFNVMIGPDYKPLGGKWNLGSESAGNTPKDYTPPSFGVFGDNKFVQEATSFVEEHFAENPGSTDFIWPTSRDEAIEWLQDFLNNRLDDFATYLNTVDEKAAWLNHSALSSSLNIGLLTPQEVVDSALSRHKKKPVPLPSLEAFIRQVLGWREFARGIYLAHGNSLKKHNAFKQQRRMTDDWYGGGLGLPPFDDLLDKVNQHAYAYHSERLMIAGNLMMLCEIHPEEVYNWFNELFIDAYDWVVLPSVYAFSQFADGGNIIEKPFISGSSYIIQNSSYKHGDWSDVWDGLFWRFVDKHKSLLSRSKHTRTLVNRHERLSPDQKRIIGYRADDFLAKYTR